MKKALTQTIIVFVTLSLIAGGFALAQNVPDEEIQETSKEAIVAQKEAEIATKVAEKEAEAARKQLEAEQKEMQSVRKQLQAQLSQVAEQKEFKGVEKVRVQLDKLLAEQEKIKIPEILLAAPRTPLLGHSGGGAVLVIPAAQMKVEDLAAITEDMSVMSRIFDNKLSQAHLTTGRASLFVVLDPFSGHNSGTIEAIFLEDYGALFLMKVNVLLSPPPEEPEEKETEEEDTDPLWTQMRQEIYAPEEADRRRRSDDRPEEKYDVEKVEELKETLIKTLKHAANIRALKPDQLVILTVIGGRSQSGTRTVTRTRSYSYGRDSRIFRTEPGAGSGSFSPTVLTIRAKKSDIDAFAEGKLNFDQFTEKTQLLSYSYLGENVGGPSRSSPTDMYYGGRSSGRSSRSGRSLR